MPNRLLSDSASVGWAKTASRNVISDVTSHLAGAEHLCYDVSAMTWTVEYFEQPDGTQPAELFEDDLARQHPKLLGKLLRALDALADRGPQAGGGLVEACHGYPGLWEVRVIFAQTLARELFGFDGSSTVLVHGYVKRADMPASTSDLNRAASYWKEYLRTHRISPEAPATADQDSTA